MCLSLAATRRQQQQFVACILKTLSVNCCDNSETRENIANECQRRTHGGTDGWTDGRRSQVRMSNIERRPSKLVELHIIIYIYMYIYIRISALLAGGVCHKSVGHLAFINVNVVSHRADGRTGGQSGSQMNCRRPF